MTDSRPLPRLSRPETVSVLLTFGLALLARAWGIASNFPMLRDQNRDWELALGSFSQLPLVGPATHVGGYTIGPAFYWILWSIRVTVGPWFDHLPHGGGIGQAMLQSGVDALLLIAIWRRTGSHWIALASLVLLTTAAFDLHLGAVIWNPVVGSTLAKAAIALVLLNWHRGNVLQVTATVAVAWGGVHAYTGAVYVALGVLAAVAAEPFTRGDRVMFRRNVAVAVVVIGLLQVPYALHRLLHRSSPAMAAVTGSLSEVLTGQTAPQIGKSLTGFVEAVRAIHVAPWRMPGLGWGLLACAAVAAVRHRRDASLLAVTLLPQILAIVGYALYLSGVEPYFYLSLMPPVVLTVVLALTALPFRRVAAATAVALLVAAIALVPGRLRFRETLPRLPEYGVLVTGSRKAAGGQEPMRAIRTEFELPWSVDPELIYRILGGRIDRSSPWTATIAADGRVTYRRSHGSR